VCSRQSGSNRDGQRAISTGKSAPEELVVILLLQGSARVGSRVEMPVCGGAFRLAAVPVHRNGGRRFLRMLPWSIRRDRECVRFSVFLFVVALIACYIPARRGTSIAPWLPCAMTRDRDLQGESDTKTSGSKRLIWPRGNGYGCQPA
jgi:hypothetical protein